jgi:hypothetical protein
LPWAKFSHPFEFEDVQPIEVGEGTLTGRLHLRFTVIESDDPGTVLLALALILHRAAMPLDDLAYLVVDTGCGCHRLPIRGDRLAV